MRWREAVLLSRTGEAHRHTGDNYDPNEPDFIRIVRTVALGFRGETGEAIKTFNPMSRDSMGRPTHNPKVVDIEHADRFDDWRPLNPRDVVSMVATLERHT